MYCSKSRTKKKATAPRISNPSFFVSVFTKKLGRTPKEYINQKLNTGSEINDIKYLFNTMAAEIARQNHCVFYDFNYFYGKQVRYPPVTEKAVVHETNRPEKAGKAWTPEDDRLLITLYNGQASK